MLIVGMRVKLPCEAKQNNLPPECGLPIDTGDYTYVKNEPKTFLIDVNPFPSIIRYNFHRRANGTKLMQNTSFHAKVISDALGAHCG
jgi:hypothetical protein